MQKGKMVDKGRLIIGKARPSRAEMEINQPPIEKPLHRNRSARIPQSLGSENWIGLDYLVKSGDLDFLEVLLAYLEKAHGSNRERVSEVK